MRSIELAVDRDMNPMAGGHLDDMPAPQRQGFVGDVDHSLHAAVRRLIRLAAVCGAGVITQLIDGAFDPDDPLSCPRCAERMTR